jgi:UDP-N-acetyl-D-mannosaminuronic acid dehydrogenase
MNLVEGVALYDGDTSVEDRRAAFKAGEIPVAVYGLGKMGLPLAAVFAETTGNVVGADIDETVVDTVNDGRCPVEHEPGLDSLVNDCVESGALTAVSDLKSAANEANLHVIIVPTLLDSNGDVDLSALQSATEAVANGLSAGDLVVVESTVPPGTCTGVVLPELLRGSSLTRGTFGLAYCPERTMSGRALADIRGSHPRIVGGVDDESERTARLVYEELTSNDVIPVTDAETAEAVKVFEGVYRDVNIALANELARFTNELGIDVTEAIEAANTQSYCDIHTPGVGVGGHCIPNYPQFLIQVCETDAPLLRTARAVNGEMPAFVVRKLVEELDAEGGDIADATVLVLGAAYRPDVAELSNSPGLRIAGLLSDVTAEVLVVDPLFDEIPSLSDGVSHLPLEEAYERDVDGVVLATFHEVFADVYWPALVPDNRRLVVIDGRQALGLDEADYRTYTIGEG